MQKIKDQESEISKTEGLRFKKFQSQAKIPQSSFNYGNSSLWVMTSDT